MQENHLNIAQNAIPFSLQEQKPDLPKGASKFGGKPDLPADFVWPTFLGEDFDGNTVQIPLAFLAQINCAEIAPLDCENKLPATGMLYFFYELLSMEVGTEPKQKGCAQVCYVADTENLVATDLPEDLWELFHFPQYSLSFSSETDLPDLSEFAVLTDDLDFIPYEKPKGSASNKLLGYADLIGDEMLTTCELISRGISSDEQDEMLEENYEEISAAAKEWTLLCQFNSVNRPELEVLFRDMGYLYFYIKSDDLKEKRFENAWAMVQSY